MKKRIIFVPQLPVHMRYQGWWITELEKEFQKHYDEVITLGKNSLIYFEDKWYDKTGQSFTSTDKSIQFEQFQISDFLKLKINEKEDTLFLSDISFPGFFSNVLHHKKIKNAYAFCHGSSKNSCDYFQDNRDSKWLVESGHSKLFKKVFVATNYHKQKLGWKNVKVIGLPEPFFKTFNSSCKENDIISVSRDCKQKRTKSIEIEVEKVFGKIIRKQFSNWIDYYKFISKSKILLSSCKEETFGYQIMDAVKNGCIPIAPNKFSYPELLPQKFLYKNISELKYKINNILNSNSVDIPKLLNQDLINNFYNNLINEMN